MRGRGDGGASEIVHALVVVGVGVGVVVGVVLISKMRMLGVGRGWLASSERAAAAAAGCPCVLERSRCLASTRRGRQDWIAGSVLMKCAYI